MSEKLQYRLGNFEGPLDLLLFLISKHKLNICDINISELLDQYTESIKDIENVMDMDEASEFLEMAARLVYIKTAMLLPRYDDEGEKLRQELQGAPASEASPCAVPTSQSLLVTVTLNFLRMLEKLLLVTLFHSTAAL